MSQGTLYVTEQSRGITPRALVKHFGLDIKISNKDDPTYKKYFPMNAIPTFVGPRGFKLHEVLAIAIHLIHLANPKSPLLGATDRQSFEVIKWVSFATTELVPQSDFFKALIGLAPYNKRYVDESTVNLEKVIGVFEERLQEHTYLVGERVTLADIFAASVMSKAFEFLFGSDWRREHPNTTRWFTTITNQSILKPFLGDFKFIEKTVEYTPPKKVKLKKEAKPAH